MAKGGSPLFIVALQYLPYVLHFRKYGSMRDESFSPLFHLSVAVARIAMGFYIHESYSYPFACIFFALVSWRTEYLGCMEVCTHDFVQELPIPVL